jgi:hypothetical protein
VRSTVALDVAAYSMAARPLDTAWEWTCGALHCQSTSQDGRPGADEILGLSRGGESTKNAELEAVADLVVAEEVERAGEEPLAHHPLQGVQVNQRCGQ